MKLPRINQLRSRYPLMGLGLAVAIACSAVATAGEVYQWKDSRGVTQYSSSPPPKGSFKVRTIKNNGATAQVVDQKPAENPQCGVARKNLVALQSPDAVQQDSNGDGKPDKTLTESERAGQLALAQATLNAYCTALVSPGQK